MKYLYKLFITDKEPKFFIKIIMSTIILLLSYHAIMWQLFTKELLDTKCPKYVGDLARLSFQPNSIDIRKCNYYTIKNKHSEIYDYNDSKYDILTLGDSFSNGVVQGENQYYQDYISTIYKTSVINITNNRLKLNYVDTLLSLLENKILDKMEIKVVIIETIERYAIQRFATSLKWKSELSLSDLNKQIKKENSFKHKPNDVTFINNGNYKVLLNSVLYSFKNKAFKDSKVYSSKLNKDLFTVKASKNLLHYYEDTQNIAYSNLHSISSLNNNMNHLATILKKHNIKLIFMPIVDKYNLYSPYIKNDKFQKSQFFELLEPLKKDYYLINTKEILSKLLPKEKDIFYADDTHWTHKASEEVVKSIPFNKILLNEL